MKIIVFDTETTGLPNGRPSIYDSKKWPYIIQLSYILYDTAKNKILINHDHIIKIPEHAELTEKSVSMHGISREISQRRGIPIKEAIELFNICVQQAEIVIAHNMTFDKNLFIVECIRNKIRSAFTKDKIFFCTMKESVDLCNILVKSEKNGEMYQKFPTLSELHIKLFNKEPKGTHNSLVDIIICLRCYMKMFKNIDLCLYNPKFNQLYRSCKILA